MRQSTKQKPAGKQTAMQAAHRRRRIRQILIFAGVGLLLLLAVTAAVFSGFTDIRLADLLTTIFPSGAGFFRGTVISEKAMRIFLGIRLPRVFLAVIAGGGLAACGVIMQAITGNDMASPFTTGISGAAAFGAALGIVFHPFGAGSFGVVIPAFLLALANYALVYGLSTAGGMDPRTLILIGTALNYFFNAVNSALQFVLDSNTLAAIVYWSFGSFLGAVWKEDLLILGVVAAAIVFFETQAPKYNLLAASDDETAVAFGVNVKRLRIVSGCVVTITVASIISFTGIIGFVGLVAPHICRILIGGDHRLLIPLSTLFGAILVLCADTIGRTWFSPATIPVGIVISFVGVPIFVFLLLRKAREERF